MPYTKEGGWVPAKGEHFPALTRVEVLDAQEWASENPAPVDNATAAVVFHPVIRQVWGR